MSPREELLEIADTLALFADSGLDLECRRWTGFGHPSCSEHGADWPDGSDMCSGSPIYRLRRIVDEHFPEEDQ